MREIAQRPIPLRPAYDVAEVQRDIEDTMRSQKPVQLDPGPAVDLALPDVGKLTSQAVLQSYDSGAKSLETLGTTLRELLARHDEMVQEASAALAQIEETIEVCHEQGRLFALRIANSANMIKEVRSTCDDLRRKIENPE